ncbi:MAG: hypothetical protein HKM24_04600 [Gammaproteobacteria bacterium]|nr:hypothetical protein [Gammaproteobacteria bacterium]
MHEVSSLLLQPNLNWQIMWLTYHSRIDDGPREGGSVLLKGEATLPSNTGTVAQEWIGGLGTHSSYAAMFDLSTLPQLSDCTTFTEPALFRFNNNSYLGINCVVIIGPTRREDLERFVLLKDLDASGYEFVAEVLNATDATQFLAQRIEQVDLAYSQTGEVLLIGTPIQTAVAEIGGTNRHLGCHVFQFTDFSTGLLNRDQDGNLIVTAIITDDTTDSARQRGPGACTYDPDFDGGLIIVRREFNITTTGIEFSLFKTNIHF